MPKKIKIGLKKALFWKTGSGNGFFPNFQGILAKSLKNKPFSSKKKRNRKWITFQKLQGFQGILAKSFEKLANFP